MRTAVFDLETWDLKPQFGPILAASVYDVMADEMRSFRVDDYKRKRKAVDMTDDHALIVDLRDHLESFDITSGWFSKGFDLTHLRSRLVLAGERPLKEMLHLDCIWFYKGWRGLRPMSSKMKHTAEFLGLEPKPDVPPEVWMKAKGGNRAAMDVVVERCEADVRITHAINQESFRLGLVKNIQRY